MNLRGLGGLVLAAVCAAGAARAANDVTLARMAAESMYGVVNAVKGDPGKARDWVAAHVYTEDYEGVAKDALGTWMSRGGNGPDQALLLASLIGSARPGEARRFAWCMLPAEQEIGFGHPRAGRAASSAPPVAVGWAMHDEALFGAVLKAWQGLAEPRAMAERYAGDLAPALKFLPPMAIPAASGERPHVWVQVEIAGSWKDFDPGTADGKPPCTPTSFDYALPAAWTQQVRLSMVLETLADGKASEAIVLSRDFDLPRAALTRMSFGFGEAMQPSENRVLDKAGFATYTPVALFDGKLEAGTPFKLPPPGSATIAGPRVTAGYLDIAFAGPGSAAKPTRVTLFDALGPAKRAYGDAAAMTPDPFAVVDGEYAPFAALWQVAVLGGEGNAQAITALDLDPSRADGISAALDGVLRLAPGMLHALGALPGSPMVLVARVLPDTNSFTVRVDAAPAPAVVVDATGAAADGAALLAVRRELAAMIAGVPQTDAGTTFDAMRAQGPLVVLKPGDVPAADIASDDAMAAIKQRLADGKTLVMPAYKPQRTLSAWWVFDPATGLLRDELEPGKLGGGPHTGETAEAASWVQRFGAIACRLRVATAFVLPFVLTAGQNDAAQAQSDGAFAARAFSQRAASERSRGNPCGS